jgi:hypothetical protein
VFLQMLSAVPEGAGRLIELASGEMARKMLSIGVDIEALTLSSPTPRPRAVLDGGSRG